MEISDARSPAEQARRHLATVSETGTTDGVDLLGRPIVVLTSRDRESGSPRRVPLMRVEHDGVYAVVASGGGRPNHPPWFGRVRAEPRVELQDGAVTRAYTAREVTGEEKAVWWARAVAAFPPYAMIQKQTDREIPVFVLSPTSCPPSATRPVPARG